jgi:Family of unknown function (DUF5706)
MDTIKHHKEKRGGRGKETLFRVTFNNQINHIKIADNKAHIIITINTLVITIIVGLSGFRFINNVNIISSPYMLVPDILFILTCLLSVVYAIQAARPMIIKPKKEEILDSYLNKNLLFFGTIEDKTLKNYIAEMDELIESKQAIYHTMEVEIYNQGKVISRKYKLLNIAYRIFMYGFVLSVFSFLVVFLFFS